MSEKLFYFIVSGAVSATSRQKAIDAMERALGRDEIMTANIEGIREMRSQADIDAVNRVACADCIAEAKATQKASKP